MKVLHLDSDPNSQRRLRNDALRSVGLLCDLEQVANIDDSIRRMSEARFDVVLADYSDGTRWEETCRALEAVTPIPPLLALADNIEVGWAVQAVLAGAHDVVLKREPEPNWLMRRIRFALERDHRVPLASPHLQSAQRAAGQSPVAVGAGAREVGGRTHVPMHATLHPTDHAPVSNAAPPVRPFSFSPNNTVQVLHVEDDQTIARIVKKCLSSQSQFRFQVTHCPTWDEARQCLEDSQFDAVLLDLTLPDRQDMDCLQGLLPHMGETPLLVLSGRDEDSFALESLRAGADDFLVKGEHATKYLAQSVLLSMARRARAQLRALDENHRPQSRDNKPAAGEKDETHVASGLRTAGHHDRRRHDRYLLTRPVYVIPIRPDRGPGESHTADGITVDVSATGVKLEVANIDRLPTKHFLLGVEDQVGALHFATVESRHVVSLPGRLSIGGEFVFDSRDLIRRANLEPTFNPQTRGFETGLSVEVLARWCELGIFRPILVDRVMLCPQCHGVATFRKGCRVCGSVRLHSRPLIHHFACAHVGFVGDFEQEGTVVCPKCRTKNMIVGADYEHLSGPFRCLDCDWSDTELDLVGQCLRCELRFPAAQAVEEDLIGYHVERLDPLALINAT